MQTRLSALDWFWAITVIIGLFVLLPLSLWSLASYQEFQLKSAIKTIVPNVMLNAEDSIGKAKEHMVEEVVSYNGHDIYTAPETRSAISAACREIMASISREDGALIGNPDFCDFYIRRPGGWIRADANTVIGTEYPYDLQDFNDLLSSRDRWRLYPNGENWRVKYILQEDPTVILDFEVGPRNGLYLYDVGYE